MSFPQTVDTEITRLWLRLTGTETYQSDLSNRKKGPKLMPRDTHGKRFYLEYHKDLFSVLYY